ncbi:hypothetical protein [Streptomyces sp. TLI_053]|uniref:hypothetical protein n=1 Tax=Streptomyces sp. TLI_053 TaxID=1855352 RepID=UPI000B81E6A4|nr:hypothetical protein [Streptomyces sp. TLI_053]
MAAASRGDAGAGDHPARRRPSARLECSLLFCADAEFSGGSCDWATRDYDSVPLEEGEVLRIVAFTPFAYQGDPSRRPA